ncbi:MAG: GAF domain-containing protein [Phycisphaerales bacterium]|nr:GAF domain-containing protein [Phycisphaerales bacterium]
MPRPYAQIAETLNPSGECEARMRAVVDALWDACNDRGVSWVGFYLPEGDDAMVLGPSRNKPACSPIGLHGACGQSFRSATPLLVRDVAELGEGYIACDPLDRSEVVVPLIDESGACYGVLDLDSYETGAFDDDDVLGLTHVLRSAGLTYPP